MRKVKCGMKNAENWCVTVGKMRNTELCAVCRHAGAIVGYLCPHDVKDLNLGYRTCLKGFACQLFVFYK